jgi:type II secretory pathway component PulF
MSTISFEYKAIDASGSKKSGTAQASSEQEAFRQLSAMGLTPLSIKAIAGKVRGKGMKLRALAQFTGQLSVLVSARLSLSEGLHAISEQEPDQSVKAIVRDVSQRVASGQNIADSMAAHPRAFDDVYCETVRAAERSGNLPKALEYLSTMLERQEETRRQIKGALMYPSCVILALTGGVTFLIAYVVPKFAKMFSERGVELPIFTRILQGFGTSMQSYWWVYLGAIALIFFALRWAWRNKNGRRIIESLLHKVPYLKAVLVAIAMQRFSQVLGSSIQSGLGLIESLELSAKAAGRPLLTADIEYMIASVKSGGRLTEALGKCNYITPFTKRMIIAGESSAELPRMCGVIARHYEREGAHLTKNVSTVIEPLLVVIIAGVVMVVALAIFLPMWNMVQLMG